MISVIIPALNEAGNIAPLLTALRAEEASHEIIVIDGGSTDSTAATAEAAGARVVSSPPGRGLQIVRGVEAATGDILLFLHADSLFPRGGLAAIAQALDRDPRLVGGNFRLLFDGGTPFSRWLTGFYAKLRWIGLYYGDSGIFVRRAVYDAIGGIRPIALMEDLDFVQRLERCGKTCRIQHPPLVTSSRRFEGRAPMAIVYGWIKLHLMFWFGASPDRLARIYAAQAPVRGSRSP